jgi:hypothetical protein
MISSFTARLWSSHWLACNAVLSRTQANEISLAIALRKQSMRDMLSELDANGV